MGREDRTVMQKLEEIVGNPVRAHTDQLLAAASLSFAQSARWRQEPALGILALLQIIKRIHFLGGCFRFSISLFNPTVTA